MNYYDNYKVDGAVRKAFEIATFISVEFDDEKTRSAYVLAGLLDLGDTIVNKLFFEYGLIITIPEFLKSLANEPDVFKCIFGETACKNFFSVDESVDELEDTIPEEMETVEKVSFTKEELETAVLKCLAEEKQRKLEESYIPDISIIYSDKLIGCLEDARNRCKESKDGCIDANNLIYSLLQNEESSAYKFMKNLLNVLPDMTMDDLILYIEQNANIYVASNIGKIEIPTLLDSCCEVYNDKFVKGQKSEILGRDKEKKQLWNIFSKKTKSNGILIGPAGVGKTAIIEAVTQDIVNEECPKRFVGYTVIAFDIESSVAGTKYRGEFETKVAALKKFIEETPKVILFIDEIHRTRGVGSAEGNQNDLSGALKSTLARDDVIVVGTTTTEEYEKFISSDSAFKRRFECVNVKEPKHTDVKTMVERKVEGLEVFHNVKLEEGLIEYIITASACFNSEASNPDKTLDLCDRAMAIAEFDGDSIVTREHIQKVFADNYEKLYDTDEKIKEITAYHEAAHYVVHKMTDSTKSEEVVAISIIPTNDALGVNILEDNDKIVLNNKNSYINHIAILLAGRMIEKIRYNLIDSGAVSDIQKATMIAKKIVTVFGMDEAYGNIAFSYGEQTILNSSEEYTNSINGKVGSIIYDAGVLAKNILKDNMSFVDSVADSLLEKNILVKDDLDALYNEYIKSKNS